MDRLQDRSCHLVKTKLKVVLKLTQAGKDQCYLDLLRFRLTSCAGPISQFSVRSWWTPFEWTRAWWDCSFWWQSQRLLSDLVTSFQTQQLFPSLKSNLCLAWASRIVRPSPGGRSALPTQSGRSTSTKQASGWTKLRSWKGLTEKVWWLLFGISLHSYQWCADQTTSCKYSCWFSPHST